MSNGVLDQVFHSVFLAATNSDPALPANPTRVYALFINDSDTVIYLIIGEMNTGANNGIRLGANGGSYEMVKGINLSRETVYAVTTTGSSKRLLITEGVE